MSILHIQIPSTTYTPTPTHITYHAPLLQHLILPTLLVLCLVHSYTPVSALTVWFYYYLLPLLYYYRIYNVTTFLTRFALAHALFTTALHTTTHYTCAQFKFVLRFLLFFPFSSVHSCCSSFQFRSFPTNVSLRLFWVGFVFLWGRFWLVFALFLRSCGRARLHSPALWRAVSTIPPGCTHTRFATTATHTRFAYYNMHTQYIYLRTHGFTISPHTCHHLLLQFC